MNAACANEQQLPFDAPKPTSLIVTDLYPTRYEAFDNPRTWCVFSPAEDGTFWHCTRDGKRRNARDYAALDNEAAVFHDAESEIHAEIARTKKGYVVRAYPTSHTGKLVWEVATLGKAIEEASAKLGIQCPDLTQLPDELRNR